MPELALFGGKKIREKLLPSQNTIGEVEIVAANRVLRGGLLTGYQANYDRMMGGPEVQALEEEWDVEFGNPTNKLRLHCIPVNSCTSGLVVACGAVGIRPGDEVIVTPYSMTCSATAPMAWGGVPVFADVDPLTFNLDPEDVERKVTPRTKAIIVVDLFGLSYDKRIDEIAVRHGLTVIEDAAQAVGAMRNGEYAGTLGHIGVYSFNLGKHLTCGEGGLIVTYDKDLATRCRLLMNHAEAVVHDMHNQPQAFSGNADFDLRMHIDKTPYDNMFGFNLRMTEISAAIMRVQLSRWTELINKRIDNVNKFWELIKDIPGFTCPKIQKERGHTYYVFPLLYNREVWDGLDRDRVLAAIRAELMPCTGREWEGVPLIQGYIRPIHQMPLFQTLEYKASTPVCENLWRNTLTGIHRIIGPNADEQSLHDVADAFIKVWENKGELK